MMATASGGRCAICTAAPGAAANSHVLQRVDADGFFAMLTERLARLPVAPI